MNAILNNGFVRPLIRFEFAGGVHVIDTSPPTCFSSFSQNRSVKQAASFELSLFYVPGTFGEDQALVMHQMLLSSVNKEVRYRYGYVIPGGIPVWQEQQYKGIFTNYEEDLQEGWMVYKICGVGQAVDLITPHVNVETYLANMKKVQSGPVKPSVLVEGMIQNSDTGMMELFDGYELHIVDFISYEYQLL